MISLQQDRYGAANVLELRQVPEPSVGDSQIQVRVHASPITQGDRRLRSGDFPGVTWLPGRLMMGMTGPRLSAVGTMFAGEVVTVGSAVTRFKVGDRVYGSANGGAHSELLVADQDGTVDHIPGDLSFAEAASLPYGAITALLFLRDTAKLKAGESVLVLGASGGTGRFLVQLARHMGARVTGVASERHHAMVRSLGAESVIDHNSEDFRENGQRYDLVFDTIGAARFDQLRGSLTPNGRYISLIVTTRLLFQALWTRLVGGQRAYTGAAFGQMKDLQEISAAVNQGALQPVIDRSFPLAQAAQAHRYLEQRQAQGSVVLDLSQPKLERRAAK